MALALCSVQCGSPCSSIVLVYSTVRHLVQKRITQNGERGFERRRWMHHAPFIVSCCYCSQVCTGGVAVFWPDRRRLLGIQARKKRGTQHLETPERLWYPSLVFTLIYSTLDRILFLWPRKQNTPTARELLRHSSEWGSLCTHCCAHSTGSVHLMQSI